MNRRQYLLTIGGVAGVSGCVGDLPQGYNSRPIDDIKDSAQTIEYEELYRNISDYEGQAVVYDGRISDIPTVEETYQEMIVSLPSSGIGETHAIWGYWNGDPYRELDEIRFWGVVRGLRTYTSLVGEKTIPEADIVDISLR